MNNTCPVCGNVVGANSTACAMCGFKLVGTTQKFTPVGEDFGVALDEEEQHGRTFHLRITRGQQIGSVYELSADVITIGRNPNNDIFLNDMTVSRKHATLSKTSVSYRIKDEDSFNGVWVNGHAVSEAMLNVGDQLQIGSFRLIFEQD